MRINKDLNVGEKVANISANLVLKFCVRSALIIAGNNHVHNI